MYTYVYMYICVDIYIYIYILYVYIYVFIHIYIYIYITTHGDTGWRRPIGCLKLQVIFHKRATIYRALLQKMTYKHRYRTQCSSFLRMQSHLNVTSSMSQNDEWSTFHELNDSSEWLELNDVEFNIYIIYTCIYIYISMYGCIWGVYNIYVYSYIHTYICICVHMQAYMHICIYIHTDMYICMHAFVYVCMNICTYACMHSCMSV